MVKNEFNELMEKYKMLPLNLKKEELLRKNKEIISMLVSIGEAYNKNIELLYNKKIGELNGGYTEDDYIEALYVYAYMLENVIVQILDN